jgi:hypothetical protein
LSGPNFKGHVTYDHGQPVRGLCNCPVNQAHDVDLGFSGGGHGGESKPPELKCQCKDGCCFKSRLARKMCDNKPTQEDGLCDPCRENNGDHCHDMSGPGPR